MLGALTTVVSQRWEPWPAVITVKHVKRCFRSGLRAVYLLSSYFGDHLLTQLLRWSIDNASFRNMPPSPQLSLIRQHTHSLLPLSIRMSLLLTRRIGELESRLWRLLNVFCWMQCVRLSWAFSRQRRRSKWSGNKLSSGCTPSLTGTQRGETPNVGHMARWCVV